MKGGNIFDIQGFSVHDGPGCRTLVFLKGCTLTCRWCCNPEGIKYEPLPLYNSEKCIADKLCVKACTKKAITMNGGELLINRELCKDCNDYSCADACNTGALKIGGYYISTDDLLKRLQKDRDYWGGRGGITLTGGEPFFQAEFATDILKRCYESYIHTAIETCGNVQWKYFSEAIEFIDWIFFDLKHTDSAKHKVWTGVDNKLILDNVEKLVTHFKGRMIIRMPVIPGFNSSDEDVMNIAAYLKKAGLNEINILPVHHLGSGKYKLLGKDYFDKELKKPSNEDMMHIKALFEEKGLVCYEGYKTPY